MKTIHALFIGINNYPIAEHRLKGCLNDVAAMEHFFAKHASVNELSFRLKKLTDEAATRQGIINSFDHFAAAKNGDICLLYFSGHGSMLKAPQEFWKLEPDRKLESLVCYDSRLKDGRDLADKELSHLIWKYTTKTGKQLHFLAIFDCCHAGSVTRNREYLNRMATTNTTESSLVDFLGYTDYFIDNARNTYQPKIGEHIVLSACRAYESALEMNIDGIRSGLFTSTLLGVLQKASLGQLSYGELLSQVQTKITNKVAETQHPLLETYGRFSKNDTFLGAVLKDHHMAILKWDKKEGWIINKGAIHQVKSRGTIQIKDGNILQIAKVKRLKPSYAIIGQLDWAKQNQTYSVVKMELDYLPLKVALEKRKSSPAIKDLKQIIRSGHSIVKFVGKKTDAQYWIRESEKGLSLHRPGEIRPVFKSIPITAEKEDGLLISAATFYQQLLQVAHFENISELSNPDTALALDKMLAIQFKEVIDHENFQQVMEGGLVEKDSNEPALFNYYYKNDVLTQPAFQLNVKNISNRSLWVTALYLAEDYSIRDYFLPVKELRPGDSPYEFSKLFKDFLYTVIPLGIGDALLSWGVNEVVNRIKIIVSTAPFSVEKLLREGLEQESNDWRAAGFSDKIIGANFQSLADDWAVKDISFTIHRPQNGLAYMEQKSVQLPGMQLESHDRCTAQLVRLSSSENITRSSENGVPSPTAFFSSEYLQPFQATGTRALQQTLDVLELHGVEGMEQVSPENPLKLKLDVPLEAGQVVIPLGYDVDLKMYIPLGFVDENGQTIIIETLPEGTEAANRGILKSVKIFLVDTFRKATGRAPKYPILALAEVDKLENLTYIVKEEAIRKAVSDADCILIMVHGLIGDTSDKAKIMERIKEEGTGRTLSDIYDVLLTFDYESMNRRIQKTGVDLKKKLEAVGIKAGHGKKIHIIAHSMGGLVSRWYLEKEGGQEVISHFIQVGSPNLGSPIANKAQLATTALGAILNFIPKPPLVAGAIRLVGALWNRLTVTNRQLKPTSKFYKKLNGENKAGSIRPNIKIPYTILPGDVTLVADNRERKFFAKMIERYKQNLFKEGNDGVVGVSSIKGVPVSSGGLVTRLPAVPCNHFSYFNTSSGEKELARVLFELAEEPNV